MQEVSEDVIASAKKWMKDNAERWKGTACRGKTLHLDGKSEVQHNHDYCHAWIGYAFATACFGKESVYDYNPWNQRYAKDAKDFLVLNVMSTKRSAGVCSAEAVVFLSNWLAKESPFSEYILNRDDDESLNYGHILYCGPNGLSLTESMWLCKVSRFCTEGGKAAETFMALVKGGVDGMLAVYIASLIRGYRGAIFNYTGYEGHSTVVIPKQTSVTAMVNRKINKNADSTFNLFLFSNDEGENLFDADAKVQTFCQPFKKPDGWGGFIEGKGADEKILVERVLAWQAELTPDQKEVVKAPDNSTIFLEMDM